MGQLLDTTVAYLEGQHLEVTRDGDDSASFDVDAGTLQWTVHVWVDEDGGQLVVHSVSPLGPPDEQMTEMALFLSRASFGLAIGNFEIDLDSGETRFKTSIDTGGNELPAELLRPLFVANIATMGRYLPGIYAVISGVDTATALAACEV